MSTKDYSFPIHSFSLPTILPLPLPLPSKGEREREVGRGEGKRDEEGREGPHLTL